MKFYCSLCFIIFCTSSIAQTARITFKAPKFYPEGVAWDNSSNRFFVSSTTTGTIGTVKPDGSFTEFYKDSSLMSGFGMKTDTKNNLLWVCTGDPNYSVYSSPLTFKKKIRLIALDLASGVKKRDIDLSDVFNGPHFLNDFTTDELGNIYLTDSYSPVIYKIDSSGKATVIAQNEMFKAMDVGLNGIAFFSKGFLITVNNEKGSILKVDARTGAVSKVKIDQFFPGADGLLRISDKELVMVVNKGIDKIFKISSDDDWQTAKIISATAAADRFQHPSTITMQQNALYALNSKLNELNDPTRPPSMEFSIQKVELKPVK